jgi:hypothetical protein
MKERVAFIIGFGASLLSISLLMKGVKGVQVGPVWEVPMDVVVIWDLIRVASTLLQCIAIGAYFYGGRFKSLTQFNRKEFWLSFSAGVLVAASSFVLEPMQWRNAHPDLSAAVSWSSAPISIACSLLWICQSILVFRGSAEPP